MTKRITLIEQTLASLVAIKRTIASSMHMSNAAYSPSQLEVLWHVSRRTDMSVKDVAAQLHITPSAITQLIEPLVKSGCLLRNTDPADRRSVILHISPAGKKTLAIISKERTRLMAKILEPLSDEELEVFHGLFAKIAAHKITKGEK